jgi:XTP/dITP diphosphohydrolase
LVELLLATHNEHKCREIERMLASGPQDARHEVLMLPVDVQLPPEDGETFAENALGKARAAAAATGTVTIAEDSGIEAAALGGAPGVRSARYAGEEATDEENLQKLLREAPAGSAVRYVCAIAYVDPENGVERVFEDDCTGRVAAVPRGTGGFGYDPAFEPDDRPPGDETSPVDERPPTLTMAELSEEQKDAISHRGRAARALMRFLTTG